MADDDTAAGAGMDESSVFQIDAYVGGTTLTTSVVEEYKVAFAQIPFALFYGNLIGVALRQSGVKVADIRCGKFVK